MASLAHKEVDNPNDDRNIEYFDISTSYGENHVLYLRNVKTTKNTKTVIFWGGDMQNTDEKMEKAYTKKEFGFYSLECTIDILKMKFPHSHILIICPSQMNKYFSIFSNFLPLVDDYGQSIPSYKNGNGCAHLIEILCSKQLQCYCYPIHLIGFSRGVNVLNQLIYESFDGSSFLQKKKKNLKLIHTFFSKVEAMYFLDGGNGGFRNSLVIDDKILKYFTNEIKDCDIEMHVYGSPYQWKDDNRNWLSMEKDYFIDILQGVCPKNQSWKIHLNCYSENELNQSLQINVFDQSKRSFKYSDKGLFRHFELLRCFNVCKARFLL